MLTISMELLSIFTSQNLTKIGNQACPSGTFLLMHLATLSLMEVCPLAASMLG